MPKRPQGWTQDVQMPLIGGVNRLASPLTLDDREAVRLKNLYPGEDGKLALRKGPTFLAFSDNGDAAQLEYIPVNFMRPKFGDQTYVLVSYAPTANIHVITAGRINYEQPSNTDVLQALPEILPGYRPAMLEYGQRVLIASGRPVGPDGATLQVGCCVWEVTEVAGVLTITGTPLRFTGNSGEYVAPKILSVYQGRAVYGNFGPGLEDVFVFADILDRPYNVGPSATSVIDVTDAGGRSVRFTGLQGDPAVSAQEVSTKSAGAPDSAALFILGSETAIICPGTPLRPDEVPNTAAGETYAGTLSPQTTNYPCGCVSPDTVVKTPMGLLWASWNDVWALDIGGLPRRVGTKIRPVLTEGIATGRFMWHAAYHHGTGSYRLALVAPDQDADLNGAIVTACKDQWWLDLRGGVPQDAASARWYGPQQYRMAFQTDTVPEFVGTFYMRTVEVPGEGSKLLAAHVVARVQVGFLSATRVPCFVEMDTQVGRDNATPVTPDLSDAVAIGPWRVDILPSGQVQNEIVGEVVSKEYDFGDITKDKLFQSLDLAIWASNLLTLECTVIVDGGRDFHTMHIEPEHLGFAAGVDEANSQRMTHQYQALSFKPVDGARLVGKVFQFRLKNAYTGASGSENTMGWPMPENGVDCQVYFGPLVGNLVAIDIPPGFYQTRVAFLAAICTALSAASATWLGVAVTFSASAVLGVANKLPLTLFNSNASAVFTWLMDSTGGFTPIGSDATDLIIRHSRRVAAMLGFSDEITGTSTDLGLVGQGLTATNNVPLTVTAHVEIVGPKISVYHFERRPSGGKYEPNIP